MTEPGILDLIYRAHRFLAQLESEPRDYGTGDLLYSINPAVKVLLSSGFSIDQQTSEVLIRGCKGFIQKPFNMKDLADKIDEILDIK